MGLPVITTNENRVDGVERDMRKFCALLLCDHLPTERFIFIHVKVIYVRVAISRNRRKDG